MSREDVGHVVLRRGPLVYCVEQVDHMLSLDRVGLPQASVLAEHFDPGALGGVVTLAGEIVMKPSHSRNRGPGTIMSKLAHL